MLQQYCVSLTSYQRLPTKEVTIGNLNLGYGHPIRIQTMTTTDTMDTISTVEQTIRCIEAGAEMVRITAPSKNEAENLANIKKILNNRGYFTPLIADIHYTPNAAEIAARIVEKVRINPGNYIDKKKFDIIEYSDSEYAMEIERIRERFTPLVRICKEYGTAMRIGTNHGSLSDRIMSRYGDTPIGMVESAMEFLRIARAENYHQIILSMKSSNPLVMVQAYRLLVQQMEEEFKEYYPLHLGVTEAGDGEDGRIKSAIGIGSLLEDGIGDTIRVSLTEDPEFEIPVCKDIINRYSNRNAVDHVLPLTIKEKIILPYNPFAYKRREVQHPTAYSDSKSILELIAIPVPVVVADLSLETTISPKSLNHIGYVYDELSDKWNISDSAADYIYIGKNTIPFELPGTLQVIVDAENWKQSIHEVKYHPKYTLESYLNQPKPITALHFVEVDANIISVPFLEKLRDDPNCVLVLMTSHVLVLPSIRRFFIELMQLHILCPVIVKINSLKQTVDEQLIQFATEAGGLLLDGLGDGLWLTNFHSQLTSMHVTGRTYMEVKNKSQFLNNSAFTILQATRTRISKTEYISCPSCGRTLFDLQETTGKIRAATQHLKGVKIAIMGCIVNGPGEMADADFGYVGSGPGKITLYKGKEIIKKSVSSEIAVAELINLLKESEVWVEK